MDENSKDVVVLVGKRVLSDAIAEFKEFIECSPLYIALAAAGLLWASWLNLTFVIVLYFGYMAYQAYKEIELEILFDVESAKAEAAKATPTEPVEPSEPTDKQ